MGMYRGRNPPLNVGYFSRCSHRHLEPQDSHAAGSWSTRLVGVDTKVVDVRLKQRDLGSRPKSIGVESAAPIVLYWYVMKEGEG